MGLQIIDCTLRDGSNAIDFQFDEGTTRRVLKDLESSGIEWIDMGHGLGLGASRNSPKKAALTDDQYLSIANETLTTSKFGFFFLKKFGELEDIKKAALKKMDFIRIGSNITEYSQIEEAVRYSKTRGLWVNVCLMKAYAVGIPEFRRILEDMSGWPLDLITLMDSAGNFFPEMVKEYITHARMSTDILMGFHTHNNLQLGVINALTAVESGAKEIDASVGGLGRSSGNAPTEIVALLLKRYGYMYGIDYKILSQLNDEVIHPMLGSENRFSSESIIAGYAGLHSSFLPMIKKKSAEKNVDYRDVIIRVCEKDMINVTEELVEAVISRM